MVDNQWLIMVNYSDCGHSINYSNVGKTML